MNTDLVIGIETDLKKISKQLKELTSGFSDSGKSAKSSFTKMSKGLNLFNKELKSLTTDGDRANKILKGLGGNTRLFGGALRMLSFAAITNFLADATKNAIGAIETQNLFAVSLGSSAKEANEFAKTLSKATGMNVVSLQDAMGTYALLAKSMGMAADEAKKLAQNTTMLAIDLASLTNVPVEQVLSDLRSGLVGQSETVYKYGLDLTEAGLQEEMFALGLSGTARNLTQGSKMMLRHSKMVRVLTSDLEGGGRVLGDFTRTIMQPANQLKVLQEKIMSLSIAIGNAFIPVLAKVLPYLIAFVEILIDVANALAQLFGYNAEEFGTIFSDAPSLAPIAESAEEATGAIGGTSDAMKKLKKSLLGIDELNIMSAPKDSSTGGGGGGGGGVIPDRDITDMIKLPDLSSFYDTITESSKELKEKMIPHLKKAAVILAIILGIALVIKGIIATATLITSIQKIATLLGSVGVSLAVFAGIILIIAGLATAIYGIIQIATGAEMSMKSLGAALIGVFAIAVGVALVTGSVLAGLIALAVGLLAIVVAFVVRNWEEISAWFKKLGNNIKDFFVKVGDSVKLAIVLIKIIAGEKIDQIKEFFKRLVDTITTKFDEAKSFVVGVFTTIKDKAVEITDTIKSKFNQVKDKIVETITIAKDFVKSKVDDMKSFFLSLYTTITSKFSSITGWFRDKFSSAWQGIKNVFSTVGDFFGGLWDTIKSKFVNIGTSIGDAVGGAFKSTVNSVFTTIEKIINGFIDKINAVREVVNTIPGVNISKVSSVSLPRLATGGIVTRPTTALIGEAGAEAIIPLTGSNRPKWLDDTSLEPKDLKELLFDNKLLETSMMNAFGTNAPKGNMEGVISKFMSIISDQNANNNDEQTINLYIDGVYQGTINSVERKNTRAGKTVFSIGGT